MKSLSKTLRGRSSELHTSGSYCPLQLTGCPPAAGGWRLLLHSLQRCGRPHCRRGAHLCWCLHEILLCSSGHLHLHGYIYLEKGQKGPAVKRFEREHVIFKSILMREFWNGSTVWSDHYSSYCRVGDDSRVGLEDTAERQILRKPQWDELREMND